jgi:hypothetical protein
MDKELEAYYEYRFDMMASKGWHQLIEDIQIMRDNYANIASINTAEELHYRKGQLDILDWLISLKQVSETSYEDLKQ